MLETIVSSNTRMKLLTKFFLFEGTRGYLRSMEREFNESTNSIRIELIKFIKAGLLISEVKGKIRYYMANKNHPLYDDIRHMIQKTIGIDQILNYTASVINNLEALYVIGSFANGVQSDTIELAFVGHDLDDHCISKQVQLVEKIIHRKIMYVLYTLSQMDYFFHNKPHYVLWKADHQSVSPV